MARYFIEMAYKGTNYVGWQCQKSGNTIQQTLENALKIILNQDINITGAGRTDSGVHAKYMVAHFDVPETLTDSSKIIYSLNEILPDDVAIKSVTQVNDDAHSRFSAISRRYEYHICSQKDPFLFDYVTFIKYNLNIETMNEAAKILLKYNDFTSFGKLHSNNKTNICCIKQSYWEIRDDRTVYVIEANRFLRNMVRSIVGTLLDVGRKKINIQQFITIIESLDRSKVSASAPAQGLYLVDIQYPEEIFKRQKTTAYPLR